MTNWEKENKINMRNKKGKKEKQSRVSLANKENNSPENSPKKESVAEKREKVLKDSNNQISRWIKNADHEKWLKFKVK